jgi:hypothetical protein
MSNIEARASRRRGKVSVKARLEPYSLSLSSKTEHNLIFGIGFSEILRVDFRRL